MPSTQLVHRPTRSVGVPKAREPLGGRRNGICFWTIERGPGDWVKLKDVQG